MKVIALIAGASAVALKGIPAGALMQNNPSHWRKAWPEGDVDAGDADEDVINLAGPGRKGPPKPVPGSFHETYGPFTLDEDVVSTNASIDVAEKTLKKKLKDSVVRDRGFSIVWDMRDPAGELLHTRRNADGSLSKASITNNKSV